MDASVFVGFFLPNKLFRSQGKPGITNFSNLKKKHPEKNFLSLMKHSIYFFGYFFNLIFRI